MELAVLGAAAQSRMVELSWLCLEGQLEDEWWSWLDWERQLGAEVEDSAVLGTAARSQMVESALFGAAARSRMVELSRLCLERKLEDEGVQSAVFGAAARS